jgi:hypothetical protein
MSSDNYLPIESLDCDTIQVKQPNVFLQKSKWSEKQHFKKNLLKDIPITINLNN